MLNDINHTRKRDECYDGLKRVLTRAKLILHAHDSDLKLAHCLEKLVQDWSRNEVISTPISAAVSNNLTSSFLFLYYYFSPGLLQEVRINSSCLLFQHIPLVI